MSVLEHIIGKMGDAYDPKAELPWRIPNMGRGDLAKWVRELNFKTMVEVGVAQGEYAKLIYNINPQMTQYGIDPYIPYDGYDDYKRERTFAKLKATALSLLEGPIRQGRYNLIEKMSMDAVKDFEDGSVDFVYIDGNHQYPYIDQDISEWSKKVHPGGIVAGHDYMRAKGVKWNVRDAVQRYTKKNNIHPWFLLGLDSNRGNLVREESRTWMWVK